jgi:cyclopropane-fatty-acyl-phospholipid synthase
MAELKPFYRQVQAHYDLSNEFYALFLDPSLTYSCAFFEHEGMSLAAAQQAKIDLSLGKCALQPGDLLLDIGCGWGATIERAVTKYGARAIGLTLSQAQFEHACERLRPLGERVEVRLQGWEEFDEPVDRIVSIGALEHFREVRYAAFFEKCFRVLPPHAPLMVHAIVYPEDDLFQQAGLKLTLEDAQFLKFIARTIFPGGQLRHASVICRYAEDAGFRVTRLQSLQPHYARTLDCWAERLEANRARALEIVPQSVYDDYHRYLTGCGHYYRKRFVDVVQMSFAKP